MPQENYAKSVLRANAEVHTRLAGEYDRTEPHFRPENREKVSGRLNALRKRVGGGKLLDVGCGTGFIIHLSVPFFDEIHGVDITPAMMAQVKTDLGNITLHEAPAENLPFADQSFDAASAYSFMDHLADPQMVLKEVCRVLKPGGVFYMDLNPNRLFWQSLKDLKISASNSLSDIVSRELAMVTSNDKRIEEEFQIPAATFKMSEPGKERGGLDPHEFHEIVLASGFTRCEIGFDWFLGQGAVMHGQSFEQASIVEHYLRRAAPLTDHLFKYLYFHAVKS